MSSQRFINNLKLIHDCLNRSIKYYGTDLCCQFNISPLRPFCLSLFQDRFDLCLDPSGTSFGLDKTRHRELNVNCQHKVWELRLMTFELSLALKPLLPMTIRGQFHEAKTQRKTPPGRISLKFHWNFSPYFRFSVYSPQFERILMLNFVFDEIDLRLYSLAVGQGSYLQYQSEFWSATTVKCVQANVFLSLAKLWGVSGPSVGLLRS